jgi:alternative squalene epoxidase
MSTTTFNSNPLANPRGLYLGLASIVTGQLLVVVPYYFLLRMRIIKRPMIQKLSKSTQPEKSFIMGHLTQPEGFVLLTLYLSGTWMFNLLPDSYYSFEGNVNAFHVLLQLLLVDIFMTIAHWVEHKITSWYPLSHKPHHRFIEPGVFDAFNGSFFDTLCLILIPLYITANLIHCNSWSYIAFGTIYANYLCLIHCEFSHPWDSFFHKFGIGTAADHQVHHKLFCYNYGHIFVYWDMICGTYRNPAQVKSFNSKRVAACMSRQIKGN